MYHVYYVMRTLASDSSGNKKLEIRAGSLRTKDFGDRSSLADTSCANEATAKLLPSGHPIPGHSLPIRSF